MGKNCQAKYLFTAWAGAMLLVVSASAQTLHWQPVTNTFGSLPPSVKVYKTTDSLNGRPFVAYYLSAGLKDRRLEFTAQVGEGQLYTPSQYYTSAGEPLVVVNAGFFSPETGRNLNLVIRKGKMIAYNIPALKSQYSDSFYYPTRGAIGITRHRRADIAWTFTDTATRWPYAFQDRPPIAKGSTPDPSLKDLHTLDEWKKWKMWTAVGGGPVLLHNRMVWITNRQEQIFINGDRDLHSRTAIGYTRKHQLIILVIQGRFPGMAEGATLEEEANILQQLGCMEGLNLDGGGSSCMLVNGKETITPSDKKGQQRPVSAVLLIRRGEE